MPLGLGRRPGTQGQSTHRTPSRRSTTASTQERSSRRDDGLNRKLAAAAMPRFARRLRPPGRRPRWERRL